MAETNLKVVDLDSDDRKELKVAFNQIEDDQSNLTMEERFDFLMQQMIAFSFLVTDRHRRTGEPIQQHEREWQKDSMEQLKMIERVFSMAKKNGRYYPRPNEKFDEQLMNHIKKMKSTIGEIVQKLPEKNVQASDKESI